jgi:mannosyl-oligosaccharide alpha-1,2-mannosidase
LIVIDGIDTAVTMGLTDIVDKQLAWIAEQDFTTSTDPQIDGFDTTIRLIGGLLSAYDLITSGLVSSVDAYNKDHVQALLTGARDLADYISPIFDSPTGLPYFWFNTTTRQASGESNTAIAGTIILEYHRLSDLTGNDTYRNASDKAESYLINPKPDPIYPNLVGSQISVETGEFQTKDAGWYSGIDSFYEVKF